MRASMEKVGKSFRSPCHPLHHSRDWGIFWAQRRKQEGCREPSCHLVCLKTILLPVSTKGYGLASRKYLLSVCVPGIVLGFGISSLKGGGGSNLLEGDIIFSQRKYPILSQNTWLLRPWERSWHLSFSHAVYPIHCHILKTPSSLYQKSRPLLTPTTPIRHHLLEPLRWSLLLACSLRPPLLMAANMNLPKTHVLMLLLNS